MTINEKRQHNLRLPISRIPNEILLKIFCNLRNRYVRAQSGRKCRHGPRCLRDWIIVAHVCHMWREVALNTSLLWCHIDVLPLARTCPWILEFLRRSKDSPLTVIIEWESSKYVLPEEVKAHLWRVRELVLDAYGDGTLHEIFSSKFQNLESLEISRLTRGSLGPFVLNDSHIRAGCLRRLILRSGSIDWNSKLLQGLTHLRLVDIPYGSRLGCHDFALVLSNIPALETLHLCRFLHEESVEPPKVHLQHLQRLYLKCAVPTMAQFLPCLVVPRSCKLRLHTGNESDEICDKFRTILSWISNQLRVETTSSPTSGAGNIDHEQYIRSFHLMHDPEVTIFKVEGFSDVLSHEELETADPILKFVVWYDDDFILSLHTFLSLLPLGGIAFLDVVTDFNVDLSPEFWQVAFGSIPTLKKVYLNTPTSNFWDALTPGDSDDSAVKSLPFSALSSITMDDYQLSSQHILDKLRVRSERGGAQLQDLLFSTKEEGEVPPLDIMVQLGELVPHIQVVECDANGSTDADELEDEF